MSFCIDPSMNFEEVISYYGKYIAASKAEGKTPVTFMRFVTGRY